MAQQYYSEGKWWVSPYNFKPEVLEERKGPRKVLIHDATLRDGEQTPGVVFRKEDKVRIAKALDKVGVDRIEAGMPAVSAEDFEAIGEISALGLKAKVFTFARAMAEDVDKAAKAAAADAAKLLDKAASKGVIHKNNASRRKGRLMKRLAAFLAAPPVADLAPQTVR